MHSRETRPQVLGTRTLVVALLLHVAFFLVFWIVSLLNFKPKETVIPIDLTVVVNENLDGKEDEPPPLEQTKPEPPPPPPKPEPKVEPPPPPKAEKVEAVEMVKEPPKKKEEKKPEKKEEKKEEKKKPEPPKKTREQIMKERIAQMRKNATTVKTPIVIKNVPSGNGRTDKKRLSDEEVRKLLNQGYVPGRSEQIAQSEMQRCASLIKMALDRRWSELSPTIDREGTVVLEAQFTDAGRLINCRVVRSCGSALSDKAALSVASSVGVIFGLSPEFIAKSRNSPIQINYSVRGGR
jgi:TonB family protein